MLVDLLKVIAIAALGFAVWWDIWTDYANAVVGRPAKTASIDTGTIDNSSGTNNVVGTSTGDSGGHRKAERRNRQTHGYRR
jgi:hypothetical protein